MRYDDVQTPTYLLSRGVEKLLKYGMATFTQYSDEANISFCDRNRIIAKCRTVGKEGLKELPCPPELKQERWEHYTKRLKYSDDKARELLRQIDEFYKSEFNGKYDVNRLVAGIG